MKGTLPLLLLVLLACNLAAQQIPEDPMRAIQQAPVQESPQEGYVVEVVDRTGKPAKGAIVGFVRDMRRVMQPDPAMQAWREKSRDLPEHARNAALLLAFGERFRADDDGRVVLPADVDSMLVAFAGEACGIGGKEPDAEKATRLVVWPETKITVHIVDAAGRDVSDFVVGIGSDGLLRQRATTDRRGFAEIALPLQTLCSSNTVTLRASIGAAEDPTKEIQLAALTDEPVQITVPPTATIRVIVYGDDERPHTNVQGVSLQNEQDHHIARVAGTPDESGALFRVILDQEWRVSASIANTSGNLQKTITGPVRAGELIICELRNAIGPPTLSFVVFDVDGEPVRNERLGCIVYDERGYNGSNVESDTEGRVNLILSQPAAEDQRILINRREPSSSGRGRLASLGAAILPRPTQLQPGINELPAVRLVQEPVVATGHVMDEAGAPVGGAIVSASPGWKSQNGGYGGDPRFFEIGAMTDAQGRFELRDATTATTRHINVQPVGTELAGYFESIELDGTPLEIRLPRLGELTLVLDGLPADAQNLLEGTIVESGSADQPQQLDLRGETLLRRPQGTYDLALGVDRRVISLKMPGLAFRPLAEKARLSIPWRDHFEAITVTVLEQDGTPVESLAVTQWAQKPDGGWGGNGAFTDKKGRALLLVPKEGGDLQLDPEGKWCGVTLDKQKTDCTIRLRPLIQAAIALEGDWSTPDGVDLRFELSSAVPIARGDVRPWARTRAATVERRGKDTLEVTAEDAGRYTLSIRAILLAGAGRRRQVPLDQRELTFLATPDKQAFVVKMNEELRESIDVLGK